MTGPGSSKDGALSNFTTSRPVAVLVVFIAVTVFGFFSYGRLPVTLMPELSYPTLTVRTEYPGAAPEEVENDISRPIEEALGVIGGLERISSISRAGVSDVVMEFSWDTEISDATQDALERLDLVFLPDETERPLILHYDPSLDPVMELSLSGRGDRFEGEEGLRRLRRLADLQIKRSLEPITGVAAVRIRGGLEEEIHVLVDEDKLARTGISIQTVIDRLRQENINVAGGTIKEGRTEYMVRTLNEYQDTGQIGDTVIARLEGRDVRVKDIGRVEWSHREREILTRTDGDESVQIDIFKEADANIVALAKRVTERLGEIDEEAAAVGGGNREGGRGGGPQGRQSGGLAQAIFDNEGARLKVVADRSLFIESSINEVRNTAILGGLLAVLVLFLFLRNLKTTTIVAVSIPTSLLITFAPMNLLGISLNIMSLGGLALGIGMLVDSSIVVLESIFRCREEGDSVNGAAIRGTGEVRGAVIASTLTSIAVFFPMVFVEGIAGEAFGDLGMAVVISLLASLAVAVFLIPMLASRRWNVSTEAVQSSQSESRTLWQWWSLEDLKRDLRSKQGEGRRGAFWSLLGGLLWIVKFPYLILRFVVSIVLEAIGKLVLLIAFVFFTALRFLRVPAKFVFGFLFALPLRLTEGALNTLRRHYPRVLGWALRRAGTVVVAMLLLVGLTTALALELDSELLPEVHQGEFTFEVAMPVGTPIEETVRILEPVEQAILAERDDIDALIVTFGFDAANSQRSDEGEHSARFKVLLERPEMSFGEKLGALLSGEGSVRYREEAVIGRIRQSLAQVPDLDARVVRPVLFSSKTPIELEVHGDDLAALKQQGEVVRATMAAMPELADVDVTLKSGAPEVQIVYDRERLLRYGLNLRGTAELVRNQVKGFEATRFNMQDRRVPILVRLGEEDRETVEDLRALVVNPGTGARPIPLSSIADVTLGEGPSEVRRVDGRRVALVNANIAAGSLGGAVEAIDQTLTQKVDWPEGMTYFIAGQNEEWQRSKGSLYLALGLSIFLVFVIMAAQFESLLQPLVIMFTIPLAFVGTVLALALLNISLSIVVVLGMIMLAGIVVNNAIVLVDYINTLRGRGMDRDEAIVAGGEARLRPILMTTATTALGLLPMAIGLGDGAEIRTPMAIAVISGLIVSTGLTLLVIPAVYSLFDRGRARIFGGAEEPAGREPSSGSGMLRDPETAVP
ncbi:MAG: efflux RND transporter permease subunit [Acidobacteriota bacterium]